MKDVIIYSTPTCHFCHMAKDFFNANGVKFTDKNAASDMTARKEAVEKSGQMGVPVIDIGGKIIVGFNEPELRKALSL
ncbi:MAG: glutaredoxin family protein [Candidatus Pacebacteria bacterium]|nr:glutaredoxin family protein [Candidatus Paceibacterota bacterium]MDD5357226.1 glutaredoxin family protein [Candidatus Paceibacterota bacterium]